jgi:hypothetical protein
MERLRAALSGENTPSVTRIIDIIRQMSDKADVLSTQDLAEAIGHDLTTMVKVMKAANCLQFNPSALEVSTMARAVSVIGFNKIQNLALSLMLLEGAENRVHSAEAREVSGRALCSALLAEEVTRQLGLADPEEAFVVTALRSYGRLLLSTFLTEDYRQALQLSEQVPPERAFRLTFGLTPLEVSQRLLADTNLSGLRPGLFQPLSPALLRSKNPAPEEALLVSVDLAVAFTALISRPEISSADYERLTDELLDKYSAVVDLDRDALKGILETVRTRLDNFGRAQGIEVFGSHLMQRIKCIGEGTRFAAATPAASAASARPAVAAVSERDVAPARGPLAAALRKIRGLLTPAPVARPAPTVPPAGPAGPAAPAAPAPPAPPAPPVNAHEVFTTAATAFGKAMRLEACVVFVPGADGLRYAAWAGDGPLFRQIENQPLIDPTRRDVFTVCLTKGDDVLIQDPLETRIAPFVPAWFQGALQGGPFLLLPIKDGAGVVAVICGVGARGRRIELGITRLAQFRTIRQLLGELRPALAAREAAA